MSAGKKQEERRAEMESMRGKRVLISGGTTGIGRATAVLLGSQGARVLIFGRNEPELRDALAEVTAAGGEAFGLVADQSIEANIQRVFQRVDEQLGGIDILIANAAVGAGMLADSSEEEWRYAIQTNIVGTMACSRQAVLRMKEAGSGHIVHIGSMSADIREKQSVYVTTKAAIQAFSESLRKEVNHLGIKVSLIEPGLTATDLVSFSDEEERELARKHKIMEARDVAAAVHYCLAQPKRVDVVVLQLRPHMQII